MIKEGTGNLLRAEVEALVNTVNCVGVMGKGVALQFKQAFPENNRLYEVACRRGEVVLGRMFVTQTGLFAPRAIVNFPTKQHWRANSRIEDIRAGLVDLVRVVKEGQIKSIAVPPLGCGLGGLRWDDVRPLIVSAFGELPEVEVVLYPPGRAISPDERLVNTPKPRMTPWQAALIRIVDAYSTLGCEATHLEAQKLLYFLAAAGEPFRARFTKGKFGPYDQHMLHGLQSMSGHYVLGFGNGERLEPVRLKEGALEEANKFLRAQPDADALEVRIDRVVNLIDGFETPYGLELLATVHWVVVQDGARDFGSVIRLVGEWNDRKRRVMKPEHLRVAYDRLTAEGWLEPIAG